MGSSESLATSTSGSHGKSSRNKYRQQRLFDQVVVERSGAQALHDAPPLDARRTVVTMCTAVAGWDPEGGPLSPSEIAGATRIWRWRRWDSRRSGRRRQAADMAATCRSDRGSPCATVTSPPTSSRGRSVRSSCSRPRSPALQGAPSSSCSSTGHSRWTRSRSSSNGLAAAFGELGIEHDQRVAVLLQNVPQFAVAMLATWKVGGIVVPSTRC